MSGEVTDERLEKIRVAMSAVLEAQTYELGDEVAMMPAEVLMLATELQRLRRLMPLHVPKADGEEKRETFDVSGCSACGKDHADVEADEDDEGLFFVCSGRRVGIERLPQRHSDVPLEEHRVKIAAMMKEAIAPLMAELKASEAKIAEREDRVRATESAGEAERLREARRRYRAGLVLEHLGGRAPYDTADAVWHEGGQARHPKNLEVAERAVDDVLEACGLAGYVEGKPAEADRLSSDLKELFEAVAATPLREDGGSVSMPKERCDVISSIVTRLRKERGW